MAVVFVIAGGLDAGRTPFVPLFSISLMYFPLSLYPCPGVAFSLTPSLALHLAVSARFPRRAPRHPKIPKTTGTAINQKPGKGSGRRQTGEPTVPLEARRAHPRPSRIVPWSHRSEIGEVARRSWR